MREQEEEQASCSCILYSTENREEKKERETDSFKERFKWRCHLLAVGGGRAAAGRLPQAELFHPAGLVEAGGRTGLQGADWLMEAGGRTGLQWAEEAGGWGAGGEGMGKAEQARGSAVWR